MHSRLASTARALVPWEPPQVDFPRREGRERFSSVRPLVMRCGAFGDIVLLTVLLRQLHARFGQPVDLISSGPWTHPLLRGQRALGDLFVLRSRRTPYWISKDQQELVQWLRKRGPGPTWFCDRDVGRDLLTRGGIPDEYVWDLRSMPRRARESFADLYIRAANCSPGGLEGALPPAVAPVSRSAHLAISPADQRALDIWLARHCLSGHPLVVVHPGNRRATHGWFRRRRSNTKYWPEARWAQVLRSIHDVLPQHRIILSGTSGEHGLNADIARAAGIPNVHNVAGDLPIPILLPLLTQADSMIAADTGPAHAAAALGCPTVALFAEADPYFYRPGGATTPAVTLRGSPDAHPRMFGISATAVISAWLNLRAAAGRNRLRSPTAPGDWPERMRRVL